MRSLVVALAWAPVVVSACSGPSAAPEVRPGAVIADVPTAPPSAASSAASPSPETSATPEETATPAAFEAAPPRQRTGSQKDRVVCGKTTCAAASETCCEDGDAGVCVARPPLAPGATTAWSATQDACARVTKRVTAMRGCDESRDCGAGEMCCDGEVEGGGPATTSCDPVGKGTCSGSEACLSDGKCATRGTTCVDGTCRKVLAAQKCGKASCKFPTESCCGDAGCKPRGQCRNEYACTSAKDCLPEHVCMVTPVSSQCTGAGELVNATNACTGDADCPPTMGMMRKCADGGVLKMCAFVPPGD